MLACSVNNGEAVTLATLGKMDIKEAHTLEFFKVKDWTSGDSCPFFSYRHLRDCAQLHTLDLNHVTVRDLPYLLRNIEVRHLERLRLIHVREEYGDMPTLACFPEGFTVKHLHIEDSKFRLCPSVITHVLQSCVLKNMQNCDFRKINDYLPACQILRKSDGKLEITEIAGFSLRFKLNPGVLETHVLSGRDDYVSRIQTILRLATHVKRLHIESHTMVPNDHFLTLFELVEYGKQVTHVTLEGGHPSKEFDIECLTPILRRLIPRIQSCQVTLSEKSPRYDEFFTIGEYLNAPHNITLFLHDTHHPVFGKLYQGFWRELYTFLPRLKRHVVEDIKEGDESDESDDSEDEFL